MSETKTVKHKFTQAELAENAAGSMKAMLLNSVKGQAEEKKDAVAGKNKDWKLDSFDIKESDKEFAMLTADEKGGVKMEYLIEAVANLTVVLKKDKKKDDKKKKKEDEKKKKAEAKKEEKEEKKQEAEEEQEQEDKAELEAEENDAQEQEIDLENERENELDLSLDEQQQKQKHDVDGPEIDMPEQERGFDLGDIKDLKNNIEMMQEGFDPQAALDHVKDTDSVFDSTLLSFAYAQVSEPGSPLRHELTSHLEDLANNATLPPVMRTFASIGAAAIGAPADAPEAISAPVSIDQNQATPAATSLMATQSDTQEDDLVDIVNAQPSAAPVSIIPDAAPFAAPASFTIVEDLRTGAAINHSLDSSQVDNMNDFTGDARSQLMAQFKQNEMTMDRLDAPAAQIQEQVAEAVAAPVQIAAKATNPLALPLAPSFEPSQAFLSSIMGGGSSSNN